MQDTISQEKSILLLSLLIGLLIPVIGIKFRDLLRYQIENKEELEAISIVPVLGGNQENRSKG